MMKNIRKLRQLNERGTAAFEFCLVAVPLFTLMFVIFDLARYAITTQSLHTLANAGARKVMICYANDIIQNVSITNCAGDPIPSSTDKQAIALFGSTATLNSTQGTGVFTITASQPSFAMIMPIWNGKLDKPSVSATVPF
jgi:Flp pilus assembly protein TadG